MALRAWLESTLGQRHPGEAFQLQTLSGDASFRQYFRVQLGKTSYIAVNAPPETEKNAEFLAVQSLFARAGLRVPEILAHNLVDGFFLQSDLGDALLLPELNKGSVNHWYNKALDSLLKLQQIPPNKAKLPCYSTEQMRQDLERFPEWFVTGLLKRQLSAAETGLFNDFCEQLIALCQAQPRVVTHYDFQSRNLMICADQELAVIDFQDAMLAPVSYDLVSLLRDCYIKWPPRQVQAWVESYTSQARNCGVIAADIDDQCFMGWFDAMGLQRHVRVIGTFARLHLRDNKPGYLKDIPLVCEYVSEVLGQHPEFAEFGAWFEQLMATAASQAWYQNEPTAND